MAEPSSVERGKARRFAQDRLTLGRRAVSPEAKALVAHCLSEIVLPKLPAQQKRPTSLPAIEAATAALLGGLLVAMSQGDGWVRRPLSWSSFTGETIGRRQFLKVYKELEAVGCLEVVPFYFDRSGPVARGAETRVRLAPEGVATAAGFGVDASNAREHFAEEDSSPADRSDAKRLSEKH